MKQNPLVRGFQLIVALILCTVAVVLPYRARALYLRMVAAMAHFPYYVFGKIAHFLVVRLNLKFEPRHPDE